MNRRIQGEDKELLSVFQILKAQEGLLWEIKDSTLKTDRRKHFFTSCVVKTAENIITTGRTTVKNSARF